jgi:hypothetical protein
VRRCLDDMMLVLEMNRYVGRQVLSEFNVFPERRQWIALCRDEKFESEDEEIENEVGWVRFKSCAYLCVSEKTWKIY